MQVVNGPVGHGKQYVNYLSRILEIRKKPENKEPLCEVRTIIIKYNLIYS